MGYYTYNGGLIGSTLGEGILKGVHNLEAHRHFGLTIDISNIFDGLCLYLQQNISEFRNPSFYSYSQDGTSIYISDGGGDMFDNGNFTYPWLVSNAQYSNSTASSSADATNNINYSNSTASITLDTDFVYRTLGYNANPPPDYRPLTVLGYRLQPDRPIGFQKGGNLGADGNGSWQQDLFYNGTIINTFTVYAYTRRVFNTTDPSVCDLYMLIGHPKFNSSFGTINTYSHPTTDSHGGHLYATNSTNVIAVAMLLSKASGVAVTTAECQTIVDSFTSRMKTYLGF